MILASPASRPVPTPLAVSIVQQITISEVVIIYAMQLASQDFIKMQQLKLAILVFKDAKHAQ